MCFYADRKKLKNSLCNFYTTGMTRVKQLKSKSVDGQRYEIKSFPSPGRGRYYGVYRNGALIKECENRKEAEKTYRNLKNKSGKSSAEEIGLL